MALVAAKSELRSGRDISSRIGRSIMPSLSHAPPAIPANSGSLHPAGDPAAFCGACYQATWMR